MAINKLKTKVDIEELDDVLSMLEIETTVRWESGHLPTDPAYTKNRFETPNPPAFIWLYFQIVGEFKVGLSWKDKEVDDDALVVPWGQFVGEIRRIKPTGVFNIKGAGKG